MEKASKQHSLQALTLGLLALCAGGCMDHDYDLTEVIDLKIQLGGVSLTVPASNTDVITLSQILDLDPNDPNGSIKTVSTEGEYGLSVGDYVLVQEGESTPSQFEVPTVVIGDINGNTATTTLPEFYNITGEAIITQEAHPTHNTIHLQDDNVTKELVSIESADLDVSIDFEVGYQSDDFTGTAYIEEGYTAIFDPSWTVEIKDAATAEYLEMENANTMRFKKRYAVTPTTPLVARINLVRIDFTKVPAGQGLYAPGHFLIDSRMESKGNISLTIGDLPLGQKANLTLVTSTKVSEANILKVRGVVDPKIDITATDFEINDVPDFLSDPENKLDIANPQIRIIITNTSPLSIELNGQLSSYCDNAETATVGIGKEYGTASMIVNGNSTTEFVICRQATDETANNIVVPNLSTLIETIPDRFSFHNATSKAILETAEYTLGTSYTYDCKYKAVIPLAFGETMKLHYTHEEKDWDTDLDKYNFNTVELTADVLNAVPLDMTPSAIALDNNNEELTTVTVAVEGEVKAGTPAQPTTTPLKITVRSTGENIKNLSGIRVVFDATSNSAYRGINLNKEQSLKFNNIRITVKGGVTVDLND